MRMLSKDREQRPADGAALLLALQCLDDDSQVQSRRNAPAPPLTRGERCLVSVIIACAGRTRRLDSSLSSGMSMQQVNALKQLAGEHGGRLEKLADESILVSLSGVGVATDQAARAARCALALRRRLPGYRIALATGRGELSSGVPVGEVVDRASDCVDRQERSTEQVMIDELTAGLLGRDFSIVGGLAGLALEDQKAAGLDRLGKRSETSFVGRRSELGSLLATYEECVEDSVAKVVLVTGSAGSGKSCLCGEMLARVRPDPNCRIWVGRADALGVGSPFRLLASALREEIGLLDGEPASLRSQRLRAWLRRHLDDEDAERISVPLRSMLSIPSPEEKFARRDPLLIRDQIRAAWLELLMVECGARELPASDDLASGDPGLVLVLDDLHWANLSSIKLVEAALRSLRDQPLMVLAMARPEVHVRFPELWPDLGLHELRLPELSHRCCERLAKSVLGSDIEPERLERLVAVSTGNPLYLHELLRCDGGEGSSAMPDTLIAMLQTRLEALRPELRRVLRGASVFGITFWRGALIDILGETPARVSDWLGQLVDNELIAPIPSAKFPGEQEYRFKHDLLREVAHEMLTEGDLQTVHRFAASWLCSVGETDSAVLARHFELGGQAGSAVSWYRRAADQALEGDDLAAALAHARRGLRCDEEGESSGPLRLIQAEAHRWRGAAALSRECAGQALALLPPGSHDWLKAAKTAVLMSRPLGDLGAEQMALIVRMRGLSEAPAVERAVALVDVAGSLMLQGRGELAADVLAEIAEECDEVLADPAVAASINEVRALEAHLAGDPLGYLKHMMLVMEQQERCGALRLACKARINVGYAMRELGDYPGAASVLKPAISAAKRGGLDGLLAGAKHNLGFALAQQGHHDEGMSLEREAVDAFRRLGNALMQGASSTLLARIALQRGELDEAERFARDAVAALGELAGAQAYASAALAEVLRRRGKSQEALEATRAAMSTLEELGSLEDGEAYLRVEYAEALEAVGEREQARRSILEAQQVLLRRAATITDEEMRELFLSAVPENARTRALAGDAGFGLG